MRVCPVKENSSLKLHTFGVTIIILYNQKLTLNVLPSPSDIIEGLVLGY